MEATGSALRELLEGPDPVAWAGPAGSAFYEASGTSWPELARLARECRSERQLLHRALGWYRAVAADGPLTLVVEALPPELVVDLTATAEELVVVLADRDGRYAGEGRPLFRRSAGAGGYLEALGLSYFGPAESGRAGRLLKEARQAGGVRLVHLLGPFAGESAPPGPPPGPGRSGDLAASFLEGLAGDLSADRQVVYFWTRSAPPGAMELLCRRLVRTPLAGVLDKAAGAAAGGRYPVVDLSAAHLPSLLPGLLEGSSHPLALVVVDAGLTPELHPAGLRDLALLRTVPGMAVAAPADEEEARGVLAGLVRGRRRGALRLSRSPAVGRSRATPVEPLEPGRGRRLRRGNRLSLLAAGSAVLPSVLASQILHSWGLEVAVYDARWVEPLDPDLLREAAACERILAVEEHCPQGGLATAILETLVRLGISAEVHPLGVDPAATPSPAPEDHGLDAESIAAAARKLLGY